MKKLYPTLLILFGFVILILLGKSLVSGVCFLIGIVMIIESIWPEEWNSDKNRKE